MEVKVRLKQDSYEIPNRLPEITVKSKGRHHSSVIIEFEDKQIVVNGNDLIKAIQKAQI
jgi:hypothetical protein